MYGDEALVLVREARRAGPFALSAYNEEVVRRVVREVEQLMEVSRRPEPRPTMPELALSHAAISRNRRGLLAYIKHRTDVIRNIIWQTGAVPNDEVRANMSGQEIEFTRRYNGLVTRYKSAFLDLDLGANLLPPKDLYMEVRVLEDCGTIQTEYGTINLAKNSQHFVRRVDVERLVSQGYLKHIE